MAAEDALELAVAAADQYRRRLPDAGHFRPLAEFAKGNPLAIGMAAGQAMRDGLRTLPEFQGLAARLRQAEEAAADESAEGVTPTLAGALNYVWTNAFDDSDRARLAMLHLFQGLVHVDLVRAMATEGDDPAHLLERAALAGLLAGYVGGYYAVQPSLAWFIRRQFEERDAEWRQASIVSYIDAVGRSAAFYAGNAAKGDRGALDALRADHLNLMQARLLARHFDRWGSLLGVMQGLKPLYQLAGRTGEWRALVKETAPDFIDAETDGPIPGREEGWNTLTGFLVESAQDDGAWGVAEGLQQLRVEWLRGRTEAQDAAGRRTLAIALGTLGQIQREAGSSECVASMREAFDIVSGLGDRPLTAIGAFDLGRTFEIHHDWDQAEEWYGRSLQVCPEDDRTVRPKILSQLGGIAYERFLASVRDGAPNVAYLEETARLYHEALDLTPPEALPHLAVIHNQLGNTYYQAGETDRALEHYQQSIACKESSGNSYAAATTRYNVALLLLDAKRYIEALDYSRSALRELETHGPRAAKEVETITELITEIQRAAFA
jgi:tetratricopeptide (TPR) repeat protein